MAAVGIRPPAVDGADKRANLGRESPGVDDPGGPGGDILRLFVDLGMIMTDAQHYRDIPDSAVNPLLEDKKVVLRRKLGRLSGLCGDLIKQICPALI